ncbi:UvrD-helicase domain-containing protein [Arthrobacter bambusae]|uniref:UvrD-helicase domain-containing protein n=1 Tax=Arthrobacter bambusae TaxID=1338426 RepID=UPI0027837AA2|nr:UvrD-helicase domain-containing protein [Arthrobacter bambusae]MDQ0212526.1 DNA helicase-2/ATP-dependent DNA helicase PcrA [Arthrobacter bambusae]MDQ0235960.1 DNA helicase-2/ATP-dependent DNA helicase PcrA [Arthrobacter bambusae]
MAERLVAGPETDNLVDASIAECLSLESPRSFFLYAGAGSGKTRSLVNAVERLLEESKRALGIRGQSIAVITYTNAAADEIKRRLEFDPAVEVATIHSYAWGLIGEFQADIREWLRADITRDLTVLHSKSSRAGTKAETDRLYKIARGESRLASLDTVDRFVYSPSGDSRGRGALNHTEVIAMTADFLLHKPVLQAIVVGRHPFIFIDESQDTNKVFLEALLSVERAHSEKFGLGLFGDTMQRIYNDGMENLEAAIPAAWAKPAKRMNHRSSQRVVELVNRIRTDVDTHLQFARDDSRVGTVRLFIVDSASAEVGDIEDGVARRMEALTGDSAWSSSAPIAAGERLPTAGVKKLILEHHMAAKRLGFEQLFLALYRLERERTALLDGSLSGLQLFTREVVPLRNAVLRGDRFEVARIVRERSPLLSKERIKEWGEAGVDVTELVASAQTAVDQLMALWSSGVPSLFQIAEATAVSSLFVVGKDVNRALHAANESSSDDLSQVDEDLSAWQQCLDASYTEVVQYSEYVGGSSPFATHQGVKGLEFPRVMVVIGDEEARGFMFSYEKLFGAKVPTAADQKNQLQNLDTSIDRTRRLFYVTCSRAEESLAIVAYTSAPESVRNHAVSREWFSGDEIEML